MKRMNTSRFIQTKGPDILHYPRSSEPLFLCALIT